MRVTGCEYYSLNSERKFVTLMGRDWIEILNPKWRNKLEVNAIGHTDDAEANVKERIESIRNDFPAVFSNIAEGTIKHFKAGE